MQALTGVDLDAYKSPQLRRRLDGYLNRLHIATWGEFHRQTSGNAEAFYQLRDYLAINVSSFFRDPKKWAELREAVLPALHRVGLPLTAWSAACSHGAEAYSLAILCQEDANLRQSRIIGTDIDQAVLQQAKAGGPYTADEVKNVAGASFARWFKEEGGSYYVLPALRSRVQFMPMDLLQSKYHNHFDLILCRNVLIYFTENAKRQVLTNLAEALKSRGVLFIGATETIPHEQELGLARVGISFYQRA
jgi:chemotaxis protein methyltransferase CheR